MVEFSRRIETELSGTMWRIRLGSTVALLDNTQSKTDTFTYWPYGGVRTKTGSSVTPFQFVGTLGYYQDSISRMYVRARTLRMDIGRWLTEYPIGLRQASTGMPIVRIVLLD